MKIKSEDVTDHSRIDEAGVTVLGPSPHQTGNPTFSNVQMEVEYHCCGKRGILSRRVIARRAERGSRFCRACQKKHVAQKLKQETPKKDEPIIVLLPDPPRSVADTHWPVPRSIRAMRWAPT